MEERIRAVGVLHRTAEGAFRQSNPRACLRRVRRAGPSTNLRQILENGARRSQRATQHKLNAHSRALLELLGRDASHEVRVELLASIGVEDRESASGVKD